jgi:general transcription factor 3C polypeptide 5 (transcription factor C subunit 1)
MNTHNLLIKVIKRRKKGSQKRSRLDASSSVSDPTLSQQFDLRYEVVGLVTKTCRFREMADYQFLPSPQDKISQLRTALAQFDVETIQKFEIASAEDTAHSELGSMIPPVFSRIQAPMDYGFRQSSNIVQILVDKGADTEPEVQLINRAKRYKLIAMGIQYSNQGVPHEPPAELSHYRSQMPKESLDRMAQLFQERPIWSRQALYNSLPASDQVILKRLLPFFAYFFTSGPWRACWVQYNYDPRLLAGSRTFQLLDLRSHLQAKGSTRPKRKLGPSNPADVEDSKRSVCFLSINRVDPGVDACD